MPHADEDIVRSYFELKGYFVQTNVPYRPADSTNDSDVDIVALHGRTDECVVCEVKGWHTEDVTMSYWNAWKLLGFTSAEATAAVRRLVGDRPLRHVLVVPRIGSRSRERMLAYAADHDVELWEWPTVLRAMVGLVDPRKNARNPADHVLRVLGVYGFLDGTATEP